MRILIGEISSYKAIVIARYIKLNYKEIEIFTYDHLLRNKFLVSKYSDRHFHIKYDSFETQLQQIIEENQIEHLFPVNNYTVGLLLNNKSKYGKTLAYISDMQHFDTLNNKLKLRKFANKLGLKTPILYENMEMASLPYVVKPTNMSSAKGVIYIFEEKDKLKVKIENFDNTIIEQYIEGIGVGYSFYCREGKIQNGYGHKRLMEYPISGGSSTYRTFYHNHKMHEISEAVVSAINYSGFAMFEFKLTAENELYLIEVNPRIWGSINQGIVDGDINYFENILGPINIDNPKSYKFPKNTFMPLVFLSLIKHVLKLEFKPLVLFVKNMFRNKPDISLLYDPMGYLSTIIHKLWK